MLTDAAALRNHTNESQCTKILARLKAGKTITPLQALDEFGCNRLGARIWDLKQQGHEIGKRLVKVYNRYGEACHVAEYSLAGGAPAQAGEA